MSMVDDDDDDDEDNSCSIDSSRCDRVAISKSSNNLALPDTVAASPSNLLDAASAESGGGGKAADAYSRRGLGNDWMKVDVSLYLSLIFAVEMRAVWLWYGMVCRFMASGYCGADLAV